MREKENSGFYLINYAKSTEARFKAIKQKYFCERFEPRSHFKRLSLIVRVNLVLNRTIVVDSD